MWEDCPDTILWSFWGNAKFIQFSVNPQWTYLLVHQHINDGVEQSRALGKESRDGHGYGGEGSSLVEEDPGSEAGVWCPGHQEANDHQDAHTCHLTLGLLGRFWLLLLGCSLCMVKEESRNISIAHINQSAVLCGAVFVSNTTLMYYNVNVCVLWHYRNIAISAVTYSGWITHLPFFIQLYIENHTEGGGQLCVHSMSLLEHQWISVHFLCNPSSPQII